MQQLQVPTTSTSLNKPSFLQRSASVASLVAWKERFESYSGKFSKQPTFISYASENDIPYKLANESVIVKYNTGPVNDLPPSYPAATVEAPPLLHSEDETKSVNFTQNFTALETYLKRKLTVKKKGNFVRDSEMETAKVFQWIHELPEGDNLEEFLEAYGIPTQGVDLGDLKGKLKDFIEEKLIKVEDINLENPLQNIDSDTKIDNNNNTPNWQRQMNDLKNLAYGDNLEKWIESLDVPYFRPIPETKKEIRKYLNIPEEDAQPDPAPIIPSMDPMTLPMPNKDFETFVPKWKQLIDKMGALRSEDDLDEWLESLEVPHNVDKMRIQADIKKFFKHETFENFQGKSAVLQNNHIAKQLWDKFEDCSTLKQVGMIAGTTAVLGLIAVLSTTLLSFAVPPIFATSGFFTEVFAQYFLQRQEVAFNLLNFHAQNAKPLSTAWAKQYVLWKYM